MDGRLETASGAATPEVWEREVSQEPTVRRAVPFKPRALARFLDNVFFVSPFDFLFLRVLEVVKGFWRFLCLEVSGGV